MKGVKSMESKINQLHEMIKELFPDADSVKICVNSQGIEVHPNYRTNISGYSMRTITGKWIVRKEVIGG